MNEKALQIFDGAELPEELLASIAGGTLSEDDVDWVLAMMSAARRLKWDRDKLIRMVEEIIAHEDDPAELERLNDGIAYIREHW